MRKREKRKKNLRLRVKKKRKKKLLKNPVNPLLFLNQRSLKRQKKVLLKRKRVRGLE